MEKKIKQSVQVNYEIGELAKRIKRTEKWLAFVLGIITGFATAPLLFIFVRYLFSLYQRSKPNEQLSIIIALCALIFSVLSFFLGRWTKGSKKQ